MLVAEPQHIRANIAMPMNQQSSECELRDCGDKGCVHGEGMAATRVSGRAVCAGRCTRTRFRNSGPVITTLPSRPPGSLRLAVEPARRANRLPPDECLLVLQGLGNWPQQRAACHKGALV